MNYEYANFNIEISSYTADENEAEQFKVRLLPSSGVQPLEGQSLSEAETVELTTDTRDMVRWIEERKLKTLDELIELGERLAALIFPDRVRQDLTSTLNILKDRQKTARTSGEKVWVLRIKLIIDSYALADLPWEYVYLLPPNTPKKQKDITGFLALDRDVSIVRYPVVSGASGEFAPITSGPVKMLAVFADAVSPAYAALDMAQEKRILDEALTGTPIQKTDCEMATLANVGQMLNAQRPHIFHFSGHGIFEGESSGEVYGSKVGRGSLVLVDENKAPMKLAADGVALLLGKRQIRLAMLGACEVAKRGVVNAWTGVIPALMRAGIPAAIGMQFRVKDANAILFSRAFYHALANGHSIEAALTEGRIAVALRGPRTVDGVTETDEQVKCDRDWGTPVLYWRAEGNSVLIPKSGGESSSAIATASPSLPPPPEAETTREAKPKRKDVLLSGTERVELVNILAKCKPFRGNDALRSFFEIDQLAPFTDGVEEASTSKERAAFLYGYLRNQSFKSKNALLIFIEALRDGEPESTGLREELQGWADKITTHLNS